MQAGAHQLVAMMHAGDDAPALQLGSSGPATSCAASCCFTGAATTSTPSKTSLPAAAPQPTRAAEPTSSPCTVLDAQNCLSFGLDTPCSDKAKRARQQLLLPDAPPVPADSNNAVVAADPASMCFADFDDGAFLATLAAAGPLLFGSGGPPSPHAPRAGAGDANPFAWKPSPPAAPAAAAPAPPPPPFFMLSNDADGGNEDDAMLGEAPPLPRHALTWDFAATLGAAHHDGVGHAALLLSPLPLRNLISCDHLPGPAPAGGLRKKRSRLPASPAAPPPPPPAPPADDAAIWARRAPRRLAFADASNDAEMRPAPAADDDDARIGRQLSLPATLAAAAASPPPTALARAPTAPPSALLWDPVAPLGQLLPAGLAPVRAPSPAVPTGVEWRWGTDVSGEVATVPPPRAAREAARHAAAPAGSETSEAMSVGHGGGATPVSGATWMA